MKVILVSAIFLCLVIPDASAQEKYPEGFTLIKKDGDISLFERMIFFPGSTPPQAAREVKAEFPVPSNIYRVVSLLRDATKIKIWQSHVSDFKVYLQADTTFWLEYSYHDIPWPVSDQDHFLEYKLYEKVPGQEFLITFKSRVDPLRAPLKDGVTRMVLGGSWRLEQVGLNQVRVTYRIVSMPIGIPRLFTDPVIRINMLSTIKALTKLAGE